MPNASVTSDRLTAAPIRRASLAVAGAAVLTLSMLLTVAPVLGAANNGNGNGNGNGSSGSSDSTGTHGTSGNVKVHDAGTGVEAIGTDNEPHVCAFWLEFSFDAPFEAGTWTLVTWAPTGDGSTVASGAYDTTGDGTDASGVIEVPAGHYRVEWAASGATSSKKKTFWVDSTCGQAVESQPESPPEEVTPPTDAPGSPDEDVQPEELVLAESGTAPAEDGTPQEEAPTDEASAADEEDVPPADEPGAEDEALALVDDAGPVGAGAPGASDPATPAQDQLGGIGGQDEPTMPDTAAPATPSQGGLVATIGLLVMIAAHAVTQRGRRSEREVAA